ncbi:hypothetical protein TsFJ059_000630 [Trichoderma semiorbis]|uniref:Uncharacterized protein n=1 Tax=Trichoderma semiorbis TaxID=1491008 RepID=A0A9P8HMB8_9HYPO|nr:hypothetical protein TsFJ059_000630 [Trichoderma semiorbis]
MVHGRVQNNHLVSDNGRLSTTAPSAWKQCPMLVHTLACARDGFNTMEEHWGRLRMAIWANAGADHRRELQDQQESRSFVCHEKQKGLDDQYCCAIPSAQLGVFDIPVPQHIRVLLAVNTSSPLSALLPFCKLPRRDRDRGLHLVAGPAPTRGIDWSLPARSRSEGKVLPLESADSVKHQSTTLVFASTGATTCRLSAAAHYLECVYTRGRADVGILLLDTSELPQGQVTGGSWLQERKSGG